MESSIQHENAQDNQDKLRATKIYLSTQEAWLLFCSLGRHKLCDLEFKKKWFEHNFFANQKTVAKRLWEHS